MSEESSAKDLERGLFSRVRTWRDLFPWLGLLDGIRPVSTLAVLLLVATAIAASLIVNWMFVDSPRNSAPGQRDLFLSFDSQEIVNLSRRADAVFSGASSSEPSRLAAPMIVLRNAGLLLCGPTISLLTDASPNTRFSDRVWMCLHQLVLACVWMVPAGFVIRQSGLSMAGRIQLGTVETLRLIARRSTGFLGVGLIPVLIVFAVYLYYLLVDLAREIPSLGTLISTILDIVGLPLALFGGLVGFGATIAVPLGWASVGLERNGSSFDGASRGYEYTLRRPLHWCGYGLIGFVILYVLTAIALGVSCVAIDVISLASTQFGVSTKFDAARFADRISVRALSFVPLVVALSVFWSLVAWLYLLLRKSTNYQEVEDLWEQPRPATTQLPTLEVSRDEGDSDEGESVR